MAQMSERTRHQVRFKGCWMEGVEVVEIGHELLSSGFNFGAARQHVYRSGDSSFGLSLIERDKERAGLPRDKIRG